MKRSFGFVVLLLLTLGAAAQPSATTADVHQIAAAVDRRYNALQSLETGFTQIYQSAGGSRAESGTLWLKRPGKMRWEYREPREKLFLTNGDTAWFYVPGDRQARRISVKKLDDLRSPLRYLLGKTKLQKEFEGLSLAPDVKPLNSADVVLRGVPKGARDRVNQVLLEITPERQISRIVIEEVDGSITEFRFRDQKTNLPISDERFRFVAPPGVETIDVTQVGN